jgi:hypothetical protein
MRTIAICLGAMIVSFVVDGVLRHFMTPDFGHLIVRMSTTPPDSSQWDDIWQQWHHVNIISVFVLAPMAGFASGIFVGLLQRNYAALIAACSQIPELLYLSWSDRAKSWVHSPTGAASAVGQHLLPVIAAMLAVVLCLRMLGGTRSGNNSETAPASQGV